MEWKERKGAVRLCWCGFVISIYSGHRTAERACVSYPTFFFFFLPRNPARGFKRPTEKANRCQSHILGDILVYSLNVISAKSRHRVLCKRYYIAQPFVLTTLYGQYHTYCTCSSTSFQHDVRTGIILYMLFDNIPTYCTDSTILYMPVAAI